MGDSEQFYHFFYNFIENKITTFINTDANLRNIRGVEDQKKHILNSLFLTYENINIHDSINMINNNLTIYLKMIEFVRDMERPYMPVLIDFTKIHYVFNRFCYHYASMCMNNGCAFSQNIHTRILNMRYIQN